MLRRRGYLEESGAIELHHWDRKKLSNLDSLDKWGVEFPYIVVNQAWRFKRKGKWVGDALIGIDPKGEPVGVVFIDKKDRVFRAGEPGVKRGVIGALKYMGYRNVVSAK